MAGVNFIFDGSAEGLKAAATEATSALKKAETQGEATTAATNAVADANDDAAKSFDKASTATKAATKATKAFEDSAEKTARAVDDLGKETKRAASKMTTDFDAVEKSADKLSGGMVGDFKDIGAGLAALGPVGVTVGALAIGMTAAAGAAVAMAVEVVALTRDATRAIEALEGMRGALAVSDAEIAGIRDANAALDLMTKAGDRLKVGIAGGVAPAVERIAVLISALGFATIDAINYFGGFGKVLTDVVNFAVSPFNTSVAMAIEAGLALSKTFGGPAPQALQDFAASFAESIKPVASFEVGIIAAEQSLAGYVAQARAALADDDLAAHFKANEDAAAAAAKGTEDAGKKITKATKEIAEVTKEAGTIAAGGLAGSLAISLPAVEEALAATVEAVTESEIAQTEIVAEQVAERQRITQEGWAAITGYAMEAAQSLYGLWDQLAQQEVDRLDARVTANAETAEEIRAKLETAGEEMTAAERKNLEARLTATEAQGVAMEALQREAVMRQFRAQQAASLVSIAIDTVTAALRALAELGPTAGAIAAGAIIISGAAAAGTVTSQSPPTFHDGGMIDNRARLASDEVPITAKTGEFMVNSRAAANNRPALEEMNRTGRASGGGVTVVIGGQAISDYLVRDANSDSAFGRLFIDPLPSARMAYR